LVFSVYALFKEHRFAEERIKIEKIFERKISSYTDLYGIIMELDQVLLQEKALSKSSDKSALEALTHFDKRLYTILLRRLYPFTLQGKHIYLSDELADQVLELVSPAYYRAGVLGFDLMEEIEHEDQLGQIVEEYREKIRPEEVSEKVTAIREVIQDDLELERKRKEFAPRTKDQSRSDERSDRFLEEIVVSVIGASIFSYFMVRTLDLFLQEYIKGLPYNLSPSDPLVEHVWFQLRVYAPIGLIILIDALLFLILVQQFFWPALRSMTHPIGYLDIIASLLLILPFSLVPWPIQRLFTATFLEQGNWLIHLPPSLIWFVGTLVCIYAAREIEKRK